jgi:Tfp pilus assembly protein PilF
MPQPPGQEGVSFANLGSVYLAQGDNARAEEMFRRALTSTLRSCPLIT